MTEQHPKREQDANELSDEAREDRAKAEEEVAERRQAETSPDPHHELANPASDPDPTEYPDPYEERPDPRAPGEIDAPAKTGEGGSEGRGEETPRDPSTSDPPPPQNIDRLRGGEGEGDDEH